MRVSMAVLYGMEMREAEMRDADIEASIRTMWKVKERADDNIVFLELPTHRLALGKTFLSTDVLCSLHAVKMRMSHLSVWKAKRMRFSDRRNA